MIPEFQKQLHGFVNKVVNAPTSSVNGNGLYVVRTKEEEQYESVMSMVYTLVDDGRLNDLYEAIKKAFPEYYYEPEDL